MHSPHQFEVIAGALDWLVENRQQQPSLTELARHVGLSPAHLQRVFKAYAGISPKQFVKFLTKEEALHRLKRGETVLDAALECGLSGPGRLHDLMLTTESMTPGQVRRSAAGVAIGFGFGETPFGTALVGWTEHGICFLGFCLGTGTTATLAQLEAQWPGARLKEHAQEAERKLQAVFATTLRPRVPVYLRGTPFQLKVWEALLSIPPATHCSYGHIAARVKRPGASRAVGAAIGRNPVAWLIPCHRVITGLGGPGGYRWGVSTKLAMIGYEAALG
ncbi:MAG: methylated-DNA--[protein]-cysteine S-methyltransferase [Xanthomonadales bacterium]|nr:methylated-DNA--[protein]-cysteine S-methyltransferase [Xanthomonadales bacterium]NIN74038.1 methylated-DNA--[protein]-cysteine S-methyltransferase [Xanthomonadales bacterium]NIO12424.1 methylated-DNA--[protein]-cysteine S-methyltransferase [Xanthomonadales bacterium]NIP11163.1 methylated-DNA--[protein]-cysteine S-methyltransferase [Xanthomonadales bacterium]NIP74669.1 methylated-DNA--[protein]-cysteine S-methyltransferase [Xanthomonadales bacterium]